MMCDIPIIASSSDFFGFRVFNVLVPLPISTLKRTPFVQNMTDEFFPPFDSRRIYSKAKKYNKTENILTHIAQNSQRKHRFNKAFAIRIKQLYSLCFQTHDPGSLEAL